MLGDFRLDNVGIRRSRRLAEIDLDHPAAVGIGRGENLQRVADPGQRRLSEIEIAIDALDRALAAKRGEPLVDLLADGAEFRVGRVAQRQHAELDAVEARGALAHQFAIGAHGARRRIALAPGGGDEHQTLGLGEVDKIDIRHVDERRLQPVLARGLGEIVGELLAIAGLAGIDDGDRLGRLGRRRRLRLPGDQLDAGQEAGEPGALQRIGRTDHAVEQVDFLLGEGRGLRDGGEAGRHARLASPEHARQNAEEEQREQGCPEGDEPIL